MLSNSEICLLLDDGNIFAVGDCRLSLCKQISNIERLRMIDRPCFNDCQLLLDCLNLNLDNDLVKFIDIRILRDFPCRVLSMRFEIGRVFHILNLHFEFLLLLSERQSRNIVEFLLYGCMGLLQFCHRELFVPFVSLRNKVRNRILSRFRLIDEFLHCHRLILHLSELARFESRLQGSYINLAVVLCLVHLFDAIFKHRAFLLSEFQSLRAHIFPTPMLVSLTQSRCIDIIHALELIEIPLSCADSLLTIGSSETDCLFLLMCASLVPELCLFEGRDFFRLRIDNIIDSHCIIANEIRFSSSLTSFCDVL